MDFEWTIVKEKKPNLRAHSVKINRESVIEIVKKYMSIYQNYFTAIILHGSTAINTHKESSDIDLAFVWKKNDSLVKEQVDIYKIKSDLMRLLNKNVDIANFIFSDSYKKMDSLVKIYPCGNSEQIQCFKEMIKEKSMNIIGTASDIEFSVYVCKI
jgi:predicted nucleotidyltransferase